MRRIDESSPDLVAATVYLFNRDLVLSALERFALLRPDCRIVLGGPEFLGENFGFLNAYPYVTSVFRGEADLAFAKLLETLESPERWSSIDGLCWIDEYGTPHDNGIALIDEPLECLPSPLKSRFYDTTKPFACIETGRGCPAECSFCTSCRLGPPRYLPLSRVAEDLERLRNAHVTEVRVLDRTFNLPAGRCLRLLEMMVSRASEMRCHIEVNPAVLTSEVLTALGRFPPGRLHIEAGIQTGNPDALESVSRAGGVSRCRAGIEGLCALGNVEIHVDLIAGLPYVTLDDIYSDLYWLCSTGPAEIQLELLKLLPGTPLRDSAERHGLVHNPAPPYEVLQTRSMSFAELDEVRLLSRALDNFYNDQGLRQATRIAAGHDPSFWKKCAGLGTNDRGEPVPISRKRRFRLLHGQCSGVPEARVEIEYRWMCEGMGVRNGLVDARIWKGGVPEGAVCIEGDAEAAKRPARIWTCRIGGRDFWFVYTREKQRKKAEAVFGPVISGGQ